MNAPPTRIDLIATGDEHGFAIVASAAGTCTIEATTPSSRQLGSVTFTTGNQPRPARCGAGGSFTPRVIVPV